jgi:teichuronic acid biosynthesis glycosyltransferase TuaG
MNDFISIVMPAYNAEMYITSAIKSVQAQTYSNWELLIVDDESTDNTAAIVKDIIKDDLRINYFFQHRGRQGKARNLAIKKSKGPYIAFLDADDLWEKSKLEVQLTIMKQRTDIDLIFSQGYNLFAGGETSKVNIKVKEWHWEKDASLLIEGNQIPILSVLAKKNAIEAVGGFSEDLNIQNAEDYHLWIKLLKHGNFLSIEEKLFYYRIHPNQFTYQNSNTAIAIANGFMDLISIGVVNRKNMFVKNRLRWLIFQIPNHTYFKILRAIFPARKTTLSTLLFLDRLLPNKLVKRIAFHVL